MFSHVLGFRLETNLRKRGIDGLEKASFRFFDLNPSGQIRKIIDFNAKLSAPDKFELIINLSRNCKFCITSASFFCTADDWSEFFVS